MKYQMIYLLLIPLLTQALVIHETSCNDSQCISSLQAYLQQLNPKFRSDKEVLGNKEGNRYLTIITQSEPPLNIASLYVNVYIGVPRKIELTELTKHRVGNSLEIYIPLSEADINNPSKCSYIGLDSIYINRECIFSIEYTSRVQNNILETYIYKMIIRVPYVPEYDYYLNGLLIYHKECKCGLVEDPEYNTKLYRGKTCKEEIVQGSRLLYGDYICIGVFSNYITTLPRYLNVAALSAIYTLNDIEIGTFDMLGTSIIKNNLNGTDTKGQVYAIIPMIDVGRVEINMKVTYTQARIVLSNKLECEECLFFKVIHKILVSDAFIEYGGLFPHPQEPQEPPEEDEENNAGSVIVSLITFLCLLVVIF